MKIRRLPEDFVVREAPTTRLAASLRPERGGDAQVAVYEVTKRSLTTPDAAARLAKALGVRRGQVEYCGLKDKHAVTTQWMSVAAGEAEVAREAGGEGWTATLQGWTRAHVSAEGIEGNGFAIVVRGLAEADCARMDERVVLLTESEAAARRRLLIVNYFGDQRFGSARQGEGWVARRLIEGDFEGALRLAIGTPHRKDAGTMRVFTRMLAAGWGEWERLAKELPGRPERRAVEVLGGGGGFREAFAALPHFQQQMCVEAYQSYLWNETARRMVEGLAGARERLVRCAGRFGEMVFVPVEEVPETWRGVEMPMLSGETLLEGVWAGAAGEALRAEGLTAADLRVPGLRRPAFRESMRPLVAAVEGFAIDDAQPDDLSAAGAALFKRWMRFDLPRGAYATVVLRALGE